MFSCSSYLKYGSLLGLFIFGFAAQVQAQSYKSGERQVSLIELYSSEGCSSCPPADRWVAGLKGHANLWKDFIPLNFHVDYWNRLGWVDRFSTQQFTQRQRQYAAEWGSGRVYTPGFVKNGEEWRSRTLTNLKGPAVGTLQAEPKGKQTYQVTFRPKDKASKKYIVHVALLGHGLSTKVKYGENAGETLHHEFVVLKTMKADLKRKKGVYSATLPLPQNAKSGAKQTSVVFWVSVEGDQKPIQAVGGYLLSQK